MIIVLFWIPHQNNNENQLIWPFLIIFVHAQDGVRKLESVDSLRFED